MTAERDTLAGYAVLDPARGCFVDLIGEAGVHLGSRVNAERSATLTAGTLEVVAVTVPPAYGGKRAIPPKRDEDER